MDLQDEKYYHIVNKKTGQKRIAMWDDVSQEFWCLNVHNKNRVVDTQHYFTSEVEIIAPVLTPDEVEEKCSEAYDCGLSNYPMGC